MRATIGYLLLALITLAACADQEDHQFDELALYYVDRLVDTLPPDSGGPAAMDSAVIDSLVGDWTPDEWLRFWEEVEKERKKRADAARIIAERETKELERKMEIRAAEQAADTSS